MTTHHPDYRNNVKKALVTKAAQVERFRVLGWFLATIGLLAAPVSAPAKTKPAAPFVFHYICAVLEIIPGETDVYTKALLTNDDGSPTAAELSRSIDEYNQDMHEAKSCSGHLTKADVQYLWAWFHSWHAFILHAQGDPQWHSENALGTQLLENCVTGYYGTKKSADCSVQIDQNIKWKVGWEEQA